MAIKTIGRCEFDQLLPHHRVLESLMGNQVTWFSNKTKNLIGTIALTKVGRSWNYAILKRNDRGSFQVCDVGQNFFNLNQALVQFTYAMGAAALKRQATCPCSE